MGASANAGRYSSPTTIKTPPIINPTNDAVWVRSAPASSITLVRWPAKLAASASTKMIGT